MDKIIEIYYKLYSACIVDKYSNTIHGTEANISFNSAEELTHFMLSEISTAIDML